MFKALELDSTDPFKPGAQQFNGSGDPFIFSSNFNFNTNSSLIPSQDLVLSIFSSINRYHHVCYAGSYGNGAGMRAHPAALALHGQDTKKIIDTAVNIGKILTFQKIR